MRPAPSRTGWRPPDAGRRYIGMAPAADRPVVPDSPAFASSLPQHDLPRASTAYLARPLRRRSQQALQPVPLFVRWSGVVVHLWPQAAQRQRHRFPEPGPIFQAVSVASSITLTSSFARSGLRSASDFPAAGRRRAAPRRFTLHGGQPLFRPGIVRAFGVASHSWPQTEHCHKHISPLPRRRSCAVISGLLITLTSSAAMTGSRSASDSPDFGRMIA